MLGELTGNDGRLTCMLEAANPALKLLIEGDGGAEIGGAAAL